MPSDVLRIERAYRSNRDEVIAAVILDLHAAEQKGIPVAESQDGPDALANQWYWISSDRKSVKHFGTGIDLIDAGDYDADGMTEYLFSRNRTPTGYDKETYSFVLVSHDFVLAAEKDVKINRGFPTASALSPRPHAP